MPRPGASEDVFRAVADPTRRAVMEILARKRQLPVTELAAQLGVSVPLLSRHLAVLRAAGVVREQRSGRQRLYSLRSEPLRELFDWASLFSDFWAERVQGLRTYLDRTVEQTTTKSDERERHTDAT